MEWQSSIQQFRVPAFGASAEPRGYPVRQTAIPRAVPEKLLVSNATQSLDRRRKAGPRGQALRSKKWDQVGKGWIDGPRPFAVEGHLFFRNRNLEVNPALRFGAQQDFKLRGAGDLKCSSKNAAARTRPPLTCPHEAAFIGSFDLSDSGYAERSLGRQRRIARMPKN